MAIGGSVARWEDQSGNGRHATQSTSNNRPIYRKYDDVGGLYFDGTNDTLTGSFPTLGAQTVCMAARLTLANSQQYCRIFSQRNTGNVDSSQTGHYIPLVRNIALASVGAWASSDIRSSKTVTSVDLSFLSIHTGSALNLRVNGSEIASYSHTLNGTFSQYSIASNFGGGDYLDALIFEVIAYDSALSSSDKTSIDDYFKDKYRWAW